jgi:hypothetical protein
MPTAPITQRHLFGWKCEKILHPILEEVLGEKLVKTSNRFNSIDFKGDYWRPELKSRPKTDERGKAQDSNTYSEWLVPTCKERLAETLQDGEVVFFYFWEGDNSLWYIPYSKDTFSSIKRNVPWFSSQEHFWIPKELFERLDVDIPPVV